MKSMCGRSPGPAAPGRYPPPAGSNRGAQAARTVRVRTSSRGTTILAGDTVVVTTREAFGDESVEPLAAHPLQQQPPQQQLQKQRRLHLLARKQWISNRL